MKSKESKNPDAENELSEFAIIVFQGLEIIYNLIQ